MNTKDGLPHGVDEYNNILSVFSVPNYGSSTNKAGILKIGKDLSLVPHLLDGSPTRQTKWVNNLPIKSTLNFTSNEAEIRNSMFEL
mgnify:CR=1 FL=1